MRHFTGENGLKEWCTAQWKRSQDLQPAPALTAFRNCNQLQLWAAIRPVAVFIHGVLRFTWIIATFLKFIYDFVMLAVSRDMQKGINAFPRALPHRCWCKIITHFERNGNVKRTDQSAFNADGNTHLQHSFSTNLWWSTILSRLCYILYVARQDRFIFISYIRGLA